MTNLRQQAEDAYLTEPPWLRRMLIGLLLVVLTLLLIIPLAAIFYYAFERGASVYLNALGDRDTLAALRLTLFAAVLSVCFNLVFGLAAAWCLTRFRFRGQKFLLTLTELPLAVSPVVAGLVFVLVFGSRGIFGPLLEALDLKIIFATPGILLATTFITLPFIVRELIPLMESQGVSDEEAALTLGAGGFRTFWQVTLPNIKWALFYGIILSSARALGEFGAVSVVSGHIRGQTNTLPLQVEILYNEYNFSAAFAVSSLLTVMALVTIVAKNILEHKNLKNTGVN